MVGKAFTSILNPQLLVKDALNKILQEVLAKSISGSLRNELNSVNRTVVTRTQHEPNRSELIRNANRHEPNRWSGRQGECGRVRAAGLGQRGAGGGVQAAGCRRRGAGSSEVQGAGGKAQAAGCKPKPKRTELNRTDRNRVKPNRLEPT